MCIIVVVGEIVSGVEATLRCLFFMWGNDIVGLICRFMSVSVTQVLFAGIFVGERYSVMAMVR